MNPSAILKSAKTVLVIDWPSKEVPELLARAGFAVIVRGGPGPTDYSTYEVADAQVLARRTGCRPEHADLVYSYRPLGELPGIISIARDLGASALWTQSGLRGPGIKDVRGCWLPEHDLKSAQQVVQAAGLAHISEPYIGDVVREMGLAAK